MIKKFCISLSAVLSIAILMSVLVNILPKDNASADSSSAEKSISISKNISDSIRKISDDFSKNVTDEIKSVESVARNSVQQKAPQKTVAVATNQTAEAQSPQVSTTNCAEVVQKMKTDIPADEKDQWHRITLPAYKQCVDSGQTAPISVGQYYKGIFSAKLSMITGISRGQAASYFAD